MAFVTNVLILEQIVYHALFVKEDKTGKSNTIMHDVYFI